MEKAQITDSKKNFLNTENILFYFLTALVVIIPLSFWKGFENSFDLVKAAVLYIAGGCFIIYFSITSFRYRKNKISIKWDPVLDISLLVFLFSVIFSSVLSGNQYISFFGTYDRQIGLLLFIYIFIMYYIALTLRFEKHYTKKLLTVIEMAGLVIALFAIAGFFGYDPLGLRPANFSRTFTPVGHPNFSAGFLIFVFPAAFLNVTGKKQIAFRIFFPLIIFAGILVTLTRTGYAAIVLQILITALFLPKILKPEIYTYKKTFKIIFYIITAGILLFIITMYLAPENIFVKRVMSISTFTRQPRWYLWQDSFRMFGQNLLTGTGPGRFSNVFENFAGYNLKLSEVRGLFDNAHNNFINNLCTIGIIGGLSYLFALIYIIYMLTLNTIREKSREKGLFNLLLLCSFTGYLIYGLADFDDITILFYLFIFIVLYKSENSGMKISNPLIPLNILRIASIIFIVIAGLGINTAFKNLKAESYYTSASKNFSSGHFNDFVSDMKQAITTEPEQSIYRYNYANYLVAECMGSKNISPAQKNQFLGEAKKEVEISRKNFNSDLQCLSLISLIELYSGNEAEGNRLKEEIFKTDTCQFPYRNNIAGWYMQTNKDSLALKEIEVLLRCDPLNPLYLKTNVMYLMKKKNYAEAEANCYKILGVDHNNQYAKITLREIESYIKK